MVTEIIDSTAEDITLPPAEQPEPPAAPASTAVARRERRSEVIRPLDAQQLVESFHEYQELLPRLLTEDDYQAAEAGKKFVKKSGWRKIATAFDLDVQIIKSTVERDDTGQPQRAEVWARAIAPSGRSMDGDGYCAVDERRFARDGGRQKLENDLRATATTRAMNRAISGLVGMGEVSAEEVDAGGRSDQRGPAFGPQANQPTIERLSALLTVLADGDVELAKERWGRIKTVCGGYMPQTVAEAVDIATGGMPEPEAPEIS